MIEKEKNLEKEFNTIAKKLNGFSIKMLSSHITGLPDRLCLLPGGILFFAEIKTTGKKPTKIQLLIHGKLRKLGFKVYVIDSTMKLIEAFDEILKD
jgi:hypothetical protein